MHGVRFIDRRRGEARVNHGGGWADDEGKSVDSYKRVSGEALSVRVSGQLEMTVTTGGSRFWNKV